MIVNLNHIFHSVDKHAGSRVADSCKTMHGFIFHTDSIFLQMHSAILEELINSRWREREIGDQIRVAQVWQTVRDTPNVRLVRNILLEGWYDQAGVRRVAALEADDAFPYATVKSGVHFIQVE